MAADDRPRVEIRHPWRLALIVAVWTALIAWAFWDASRADADQHGYVATCSTLQLWDVTGLGVVTVTHADGTIASEGPLGNAVTYPNDGPHGRIVRVVTAHHTYTVPAPSGCVVASSTTTPLAPTLTVATTTANPPFEATTTLPPTITPPPTPEGPPASTPTAQTGDPSVAPTTIPPARPATPTVASPSFTG